MTASAAQKEHAFYCFDVLDARLNSLPTPKYTDAAYHPSSTTSDASEEYPLFITWNIQSKHDPTQYHLRGCIGNFRAMPLRSGLAQYAIISAMEDTRFPPISKAEFPRLQCGVSLLTDFEDCIDPYDWTLDTHGIWIHFEAVSSRYGGRQSYSATFLPDVPGHAGWNQRETLVQAIKKSGFTGRIDDEFIKTIKVQRYQSSKVSVTYEEWNAWRDQVSP